MHKNNTTEHTKEAYSRYQYVILNLAQDKKFFKKYQLETFQA